LISFENIKTSDKAYGENLLKLCVLWDNLIIKVYRLNNYGFQKVQDIDHRRRQRQSGDDQMIHDESGAALCVEVRPYSFWRPQ
jgi:hypothetical protein